MTLLPSTIQRTGGSSQAPPKRPLRFLPVRRVVAALAAVLLVASGCGGGSGTQETSSGKRYVQRVNEAQQEFATEVAGLSSGITPSSSDAADKRTLRSFEKAVDDVALKLRRITPPSDVRGLHSRLVTAVDAYGDEVHTAVRALDSRSPARLRRAQKELNAATASFGTTLNDTIEAINTRLSG
jgi:hypothetical protein